MGSYLPGRSPIIKNLIPGLTERGKIKIGRKGAERQGSNGSWQLPEKLDHFLVTTLERGKDGNFIPDPVVHDKLGPAPKVIPVRLLFDAIELNFQCRYSCYSGKALFCSGDGETGLELQADGQAKPVNCPCFRQAPTYQGEDGKGKKKCKINGTLSVLIEASNHVGGVYKFRTTGYNSTVGIYSSLVLIKGLTGGILAGIPLNMTIQPKVATSPVDGRSQTVYVVGIEYPGDMRKLQQETLALAQQNADFRVRLANVENEVRTMISADAELLDQAGDIVDEFHPVETAGTAPEMVDPDGTGEGTATGTDQPQPAQNDAQQPETTGGGPTTPAAAPVAGTGAQQPSQPATTPQPALQPGKRPGKPMKAQEPATAPQAPQQPSQPAAAPQQPAQAAQPAQPAQEPPPAPMGDPAAGDDLRFF